MQGQSSHQAQTGLPGKQALAILSRQGDLVRLARQSTDDINEAALMVHRVMSRAFQQYKAELPDIGERLQRDMRDALDRSAA